MGQFTVRGTSADLPVFEEEADLEPVSTRRLHLTGFGSGNYRGCDLRGNDLSALAGTGNLKLGGCLAAWEDYMSPAFPLDGASREVLNEALRDSDLASFVVDAAARTAVVSFYVTSILPEGGLLHEAYPLFLVARPVGRIAVRHTVNDEVLPVRLDDIDAVLDQFAVKYMDDWDIVDPPKENRLRWTGQQLSLDARLGAEDQHVIELWQDELPQHGLDIGVWFGQLFVLDRELNPVTPAMITAWRQRWHDDAVAVAGPRKGVSISVPQDRPPLDLAAVLDLLP